MGLFFEQILSPARICSNGEIDVYKILLSKQPMIFVAWNKMQNNKVI